MTASLYQLILCGYMGRAHDQWWPASSLSFQHRHGGILRDHQRYTNQVREARNTFKTMAARAQAGEPEATHMALSAFRRYVRIADPEPHRSASQEEVLIEEGIPGEPQEVTRAERFLGLIQFPKSKEHEYNITEEDGLLRITVFGEREGKYYETIFTLTSEAEDPEQARKIGKVLWAGGVMPSLVNPVEHFVSERNPLVRIIEQADVIAEEDMEMFTNYKYSFPPKRTEETAVSSHVMQAMRRLSQTIANDPEFAGIHMPSPLCGIEIYIEPAEKTEETADIPNFTSTLVLTTGMPEEVVLLPEFVEEGDIEGKLAQLQSAGLAERLRRAMTKAGVTPPEKFDSRWKEWVYYDPDATDSEPKFYVTQLVGE